MQIGNLLYGKKKYGERAQSDQKLNCEHWNDDAVEKKSMSDKTITV